MRCNNIKQPLVHASFEAVVGAREGLHALLRSGFLAQLHEICPATARNSLQHPSMPCINVKQPVVHVLFCIVAGARQVLHALLRLGFRVQCRG
jgi:hypothetical protein